jgi:photosystem II stability/assembly factor-like uncharacterized protein
MPFVRSTAATAIFLATFAFGIPAGNAALGPTPPSYVQTLEVKNAKLAFAVGASLVMRTSDGGRSWERYRVPGISGIAGAAFVDARDWIAAGSSGVRTVTIPILRTADAGRTWQRSVLPRRYQDGHGPVVFSFADASHGWATVDTVHSGAFANVDLFMTSDGGRSWVYEGSEPFSGPIFFVGSLGWAAGGTASDRLYATTDGGRSWRLVQLPVPAALHGGAATVGMVQLLERSSTGAADLALPVWYATTTGAVGKSRNTLVIYRSSDSGVHWKATTPVYDPGFGNYAGGTSIPVAFSGPRHWWIGGSLTLYSTSDGGHSWHSSKPRSGDSGLDGLIGAVQLAFPTAKLGYALIQYGHCREFKRSCTERSVVLRSTDGGASWRIANLDALAASAPACTVKQLSISGGFGGATGSALGGVSLRNTSSSPCSLPQRPTIGIEVNGQRASVKQGPGKAAPSFPQIPVRILRPGARAFAQLQWFNWCGTRPTHGSAQVALELRLGGGLLSATHLVDPVVPRCDSPSAPSVLWTWDFVEPPR